MTQATTPKHESYPDSHNDVYSKTIFGFWVYLVTDFMLFATLFSAYAVLRNSTFGGPSGVELFDLPFTFVQTLVLLLSSLTVGIAAISVHKKSKGGTLFWFLVTFALGLAFTWMEFLEFHHLISSGNSWDQSAFLSAFFTVVGTHVLHVLVALFWIIVLLVPFFREGLTDTVVKRFTCLKMFWQFLNIVWIFIFAIVYLLGGVEAI